MPPLKSIFNWRAPKGPAIKIAWSQEAKRHLQTAKEKLGESQSEEAIQKLRALNNTEVDGQLLLLSARLEQHKRRNIAGTQTNEQKETGLNRIHESIFQLIKAIEAQLAEGEKENQQLRDAFRQRYRDRLTQKLASRQPVNLRRLVSTTGTSERVAATFIPYNSEEIKEEIGKTFQAAHGRMLIVGQPGAGKTTLLLQLADRLFDLEADALPVVVNLATWQSSYGKLETWLEAVLAAELGTNKAGAKAVLRQSGLILLLDGLDELKEDEAINSCLAAIADFGATPGRRFVITCRIEEYKRASEDARVNLQIEVGPLTGEQLQAELTRMGRIQPEAIPLLQAIQKDPLLRQAVETPFYFNTLQLLFAGRLPVFNVGDLEGRKAEIKEKFVAAALQSTQKKEYPPEHARHWLAFLANRMNQRKTVRFELVDLQHDWWLFWRWREGIAGQLIGIVVHGLVGGLITGILCGLSVALFVGKAFAFNAGMIIALVFVVVTGVSKPQPKIYIVSLKQWLLKTTLEIFILNLGLILLSGLYFSMYGLLLGGLIAGLVGGLVVGWGEEWTKGLVEGLIGGLTIGFVSGIITVFVGMTFRNLNDVIDEDYIEYNQIKKPYQRFYASMNVFYFSILEHLYLRYLLYKKRALPLDLVDFLNEMTARHLLETDGATWRFRHRIIQDYFAAQWVEPETEQKS